MTFIRNLPGPLLIFLGALSLSFGGLIVNKVGILKALLISGFLQIISNLL